MNSSNNWGWVIPQHVFICSFTMKMITTTTKKIRYNYVCYLDTWLPDWGLYTPKA